MKELLEDYFGRIIISWQYQQSNDLEYGNDGYGSSNYISGEIHEPYYEVYFTTSKWDYGRVHLQELLVFLYNKTKK